MTWAETVELLCVRYRTTPWEVEANATTETLRHIRLLMDGEMEEAPVRAQGDPMEEMLANMSTTLKESIG